METSAKLVLMAALHVRRYRGVNLLGVWKVQTGHDINELVFGLGQTGIQGTLLLYRGLRMAFVVMRRIDRTCTRK